jgi:pimeloyl-ACP methyl ester carboxylesterase
VFVHGFHSGPQAWDRFARLVEGDAAFGNTKLLFFSYSTPLLRIDPRRRVPDLNALADQLQTFIETRAPADGSLVIMAHSQGGLIVQRMLQRILCDRGGAQLARICRVVLVACPNFGSAFFLDVRRLLSRNAQERALRPLDEDVAYTHRFVYQRVAKTNVSDDSSRAIPVHAYAGSNDNVVPPVSAGGFFGRPHVLPGDHSGVIQPTSYADDRYVALAGELRCDAPSEDEGPAEQTTKRDVGRVLLVVVGRRRTERCNRLLVKKSSKEWKVYDELPYMMPSVAISASLDEIRHDASLQLGLDQDAITVELFGQPFWTPNANPKMGQASGAYTFQLAIVSKLEVLGDAEAFFATVGDRPARWASLTELSDHEATRELNGAVFRHLRDIWGSFLERRPAVVELPP